MNFIEILAENGIQQQNNKKHVNKNLVRGSKKRHPLRISISSHLLKNFRQYVLSHPLGNTSKEI
jgi:hypothetical protein